MYLSPKWCVVLCQCCVVLRNAAHPKLGLLKKLSMKKLSMKKLSMFQFRIGTHRVLWGGNISLFVLLLDFSCGAQGETLGGGGHLPLAVAKSDS